MEALFSHSLLVVTGKGGVGKSTVTAALGIGRRGPTFPMWSSTGVRRRRVPCEQPAATEDRAGCCSAR